MFRVEEIMTPRSLLKSVTADRIDKAYRVAEENNFDAVPVLHGGEIASYWSRAEERTFPITKRHRVSHDSPIELVMPRLNAHLIQFVYYRSQLVGLVDLSDINKPLGRLAWVRSIAEVEQGILTKSLRMGLTDQEVASALGSAAKKARARREAARKEDLSLSLLTFASFPNLLKATRTLGILEVSNPEITRLTDIRNRLAHSSRNLVETREDGRELPWALGVCRRILKMTSI